MGSILATFRSSGGALGRLFPICGASISAFICSRKNKHSCEKITPGGLPKRNSAARGLDLWRAGKTSHSEKSMPKASGKRTFGKMAETGAVRKGGLLRGKVSQGRPHPLSIALRSEGQTLNKTKVELSVKLSVFFS